MECLPIKVDDQIGLTERTGAHSLDRRPSSEARDEPERRSEQDGLPSRSRWRRFESCRGAKFLLEANLPKANGIVVGVAIATDYV